ncbi:hypothetical protein P7K49_007500 [Saguinus oedipus]|uniref:Exocyst complex component EXOC2/Sec5 N-terminal domain-containing protein n=1 Tax=Saguinus oedipus TaxID=9490 RepID=A0ABQ9VV18_SAGOE|nr:hypothetical protein P7K49_007500 [Saguinus oedipus]
MASLKELDQRLFENYIELKADPIVGSLEPGIYAGYFDWKDCLPPTVKPGKMCCASLFPGTLPTAPVRHPTASPARLNLCLFEKLIFLKYKLDPVSPLLKTLQRGSFSWWLTPDFSDKVMLAFLHL